MALPDSELPQWPRPRRIHRVPARFAASDWPEETADDIIHHPDLRAHPLGQSVKAQSLTPALMLLLFFALASLWSWTQPDGSLLAASKRTVFEEGQVWRLLSTLAVHADLTHLLANSGLFLIFGLFLRQYFGLWAFPLLSLLGGIVTSALALLTYGADVQLIGASGMVYFMAALWLVLFFRYADYLSWGQRLMRAIAFALVVLVPTQFEPSVSYRTHAIGFALGVFFGWLLGPWMQPLASPAKADMEESEYSPSASEIEEELLP